MERLKTDHSKFNNDWYKPGGTFFKRVSWYFISAWFFKSSFPLYGPKRLLLRMYGAKIGKDVTIKPHVTVNFHGYLIVTCGFIVTSLPILAPYILNNNLFGP